MHGYVILHLYIKTPLQYVSAYGRGKAVQFLLENDVDCSIKDCTGRNALEIARYFQKDNVVLILERHLYGLKFQSRLILMVDRDISFVFGRI